MIGKQILLFTFVAIFHEFSFAKEVPLGLRPAKAVDEPEKPIVPKLEQQQNQQQQTELGLEEQSPNNIAKSSVAENGPNAVEEGNARNEEQNAISEKPPLVFQRTGKSKRRLSPLVPGTAGTQVVQQVIKPNPEQSDAIFSAGTSAKPAFRTIPPPAGKDYGVNTLLQTNLVDSKGRVLKGGHSSFHFLSWPPFIIAEKERNTVLEMEEEKCPEVSAVPIPVPDIRNAKASRASASRVETEAEKAVQINFSG